MIGGQDQRVAEGGQAVQSGRDTHITQGINSDDMKQIIETLGDQLPKFLAAASAIMEERLKSFKEEVIERFEKDASTSREAFADPDFLSVLADAQKGYARTGKADTHAILLDMIAERSKVTTGSRRAFTINEAIEVAQKLGSSELCELAFNFIMRRTRRLTICSWNDLSNHYSRVFSEFLPHIEKDDASYNYLVSQRCASISMGHIDLADCIKGGYEGLFLKGRSIEDYRNHFPDFAFPSQLLVPAVFDQAGLQPNAMNRETWRNATSVYGIEPSRADALWSHAMNNIASTDEADSKLAEMVPNYHAANNIWKDSPLRQMELTTIGIVIAHGRLASFDLFKDTDLGVWIR